MHESEKWKGSRSVTSDSSRPHGLQPPFCLSEVKNKTCDGYRQWQPTPVLLPGKSHGRRSLVGCSPWGCEESNTTKRLHFHFSLSCTGEGNGNPLQCSCLENPRDGGAWWAGVYGVAQSWTRLKRLSSRSSNCANQLTIRTNFESVCCASETSVTCQLYCNEILKNMDLFSKKINKRVHNLLKIFFLLNLRFCMIE